MTTARDVAILGSTGSIGTQALDVIRRNRERFNVRALAAGGANLDLLAAQAIEFGVELVAVADGSAGQDLELALAEARSEAGSTGPLPDISCGPDAATTAAGWPGDVVLNGMTGSVGLIPTLEALKAGRILALANKESLIVGGPLVKDLAAEGQIVPVDSEHSALAQCLRSGSASEIRRLVLTASGGPFRGMRRSELQSITPSEALAHPTWAMGPVVTTNSATLVNKGLEVIEAHLLFDLPFEMIDVVVHPQSVVHSMVEFTDGSTIAQASPPDMRLPIALGLAWPHRVPGAAPGCDWSQAVSWTFEPLDDEAFPAVRLARRAGSAGGVMPAIFNAANEEAVGEFLGGRLPFVGIVDTVTRVVDLGEAGFAETGGAGAGNNLTVRGVLDAEQWARRKAHELMSGANS